MFIVSQRLYLHAFESSELGAEPVPAQHARDAREHSRGRRGEWRTVIAVGVESPKPE